MAWPTATTPQLVYASPDALGLCLGQPFDPDLTDTVLRCLLEEAFQPGAAHPCARVHWSQEMQGFMGVAMLCGEGESARGFATPLRELADAWARLCARAAARHPPRHNAQ